MENKKVMLTTDKYVIRLANESDVGALTRLHCASFRPEDHIPMMFGDDYVHATYRWQLTSGAAYVLVAEADSQIVGFLCVSDDLYTRPMFKYCLPEFVRSILRSPWLLVKPVLWRRLLRPEALSAVYEQLSSSSHVAQMTIGAVDAGWRGEGIYPRLVETAKKVSKERGSEAIAGSVYKENASARRVFVKLGFVELPAPESVETVYFAAPLVPELVLPEAGD